MGKLLLFNSEMISAEFIWGNVSKGRVTHTPKKK